MVEKNCTEWFRGVRPKIVDTPAAICRCAQTNRRRSFRFPRAILMSPRKYGGNQFEGTVLGDGVLRTFQTPSATVSGVICWDMDFPGTVSQSGRNGTDILLNPTADWQTVSTTHATMAVFLAIENGVSLVRQADGGLWIATDPYGRTLARTDHFTTSERLMIAQVPTTGVTTVYSIIGNLFGWSTVLGFPLLVCWMFIQSYRSKRTVPGSRN